VDVHVRRLRAKLGSEHEALIGTVRNVGYRFVPVKAERAELAREERARTAAGLRTGPGSDVRTAAPAR
jgi:DNA-binding winged helix-turn-helix (wHTH) protein